MPAFRWAPHVLAAHALLLAGCGLGGPAYEQQPSPATDAVVEMTTTLNFVPKRITVPVGGTVAWRNKSLLTHTVTAVPELAGDPADVALPDDAGPINSGDIAAGQIFRHTFDVPGTYRYFCQPHESFGMTGTIVVVAGG